jgi:hypothetical protein
MRNALVVFCSVCLPLVLLSQNYQAEIQLFREEYQAKFLKSERSPLTEKDFVNLRFFNPDQRYVFKASFEATPNAPTFDMPTYSGITKPYVQYGWIHFTHEGKQLKLAVYQNLQLRVMPKFKDHLFLPFKDETNGEATYGGGRYIDLSTSDIVGGKLTLDFNKCYNPWCAYSDGFNCPIPPRDNHLPVKISAGEMNFAKAN